MRMKVDLYKFNYSKWWIDATGKHIPWGMIDDGYLQNIKSLLIRKGTGPESMNFEFPDAALYFCLMEVKKRSGYTFTNHNDEREFYKMKARLKSAYFNEKEEPMRSQPAPTNLFINESPEETKATREELLKAFGRKILINGKRGKIVGIFQDEPFEVKIILDSSSSGCNCQLSEVKFIEEIKLFLYENRSGTVEWTSKMKPSAVLKKNKIKLLTTKMIEV